MGWLGWCACFSCKERKDALEEWEGEEDGPGHVDWMTKTWASRTEVWSLMLHSPSLKFLMSAEETLMLRGKTRQTVQHLAFPRLSSSLPVPPLSRFPASPPPLRQPASQLWSDTAGPRALCRFALEHTFLHPSPQEQVDPDSFNGNGDGVRCAHPRFCAICSASSGLEFPAMSSK